MENFTSKKENENVNVNNNIYNIFKRKEFNFAQSRHFSTFNENVDNLDNIENSESDVDLYAEPDKSRCYSTSTPNGESRYILDDQNLDVLIENESNEIEHSLIKEQAIKKFKQIHGEGYLGYNLIYSLGSLSSINTDSELLIEVISDQFEPKVKEYLKEIPENITYSILPVLRLENADGQYKSITTTKSIKITRFTSSNLLTKRILHSTLDALFIYSLQDSDIDLFLMGRPWLSADDFNLNFSKITNLMDKQIEKEVSSTNPSILINNKTYSEKAIKLQSYEYVNIYMNDYGDPIFDKNKNLIGYKINEFEWATITTEFNENSQLCNKVLIKEFDKNNLSLKNETINSWFDTRIESGFIRDYNNKKYSYDKFNNLINVEVSFTCLKFPLAKKDSKLNDKIGTLDFETYGANLGTGLHQVYAAGFSIKGNTELSYIELGETSYSFVYNFFWRLFMYPKNLDGYTFYVHNLGRFDSIFIIKALTKINSFTVILIWKDNAILSLTIKYLEIKITLLDSLQLIPGNLENILKSFNCKTQKGLFPYKVVNKKSLFYIGDKPAKKYFNNISDQEYLKIPNCNWDLQKETLKYLKSDTEGLLEVVLKFKQNIYNKYQLNITKYKTLPGLALATYTSSYIPKNLIPELKMIKGELEKEIRSSYFGGNVDVFINKITKSYLYDINSQYSKAMLNDMPVGEPILSLEKDLNKIFGFVYGEIYCPDENSLRVPFIQNKDPFGRMSSCPRGKFKRLIFSEEIKYALKYGYKIDIDYCYQFKRGKDLFKNYVNDHYELKKNSKDPIQRSIAKLFLNSLYGRLGMKSIGNVMKIVDKSEIENLDKNTNISLLF